MGFILTTRYAPEWNDLARFSGNVALILVNFGIKHIIIDQIFYGELPVKINLLNRRRTFVVDNLLSQIGQAGVTEDANNYGVFLARRLLGSLGRISQDQER